MQESVLRALEDFKYTSGLTIWTVPAGGVMLKSINLGTVSGAMEHLKKKGFHVERGSRWSFKVTAAPETKHEQT